MLARNGSCCCRLKVSNSRNNDRGDNISHMRIPIIINRKRRIWAVMIMSGVDQDWDLLPIFRQLLLCPTRDFITVNRENHVHIDSNHNGSLAVVVKGDCCCLNIIVYPTRITRTISHVNRTLVKHGNIDTDISWVHNRVTPAWSL